MFGGSAWLESAVAIALGVTTWTLLEYLMHRFLGHYGKTRPNFFEAEHTRHHAEGNYFAPASKKMLAALGTAGLVGSTAVVLGGPAVGVGYTAGLLSSYALYEWLHRRAHTHAPRGRYGTWLRRHHFSHHFRSSRYNHGVTSPLWDFVFRTYRQPPAKIVVPETLAPLWMKTSEGARVPAAQQDHYEIRRRSSPFGGDL